MNNLAQPSGDFKKICTQVNPVLFEKDITIEEIHYDLRNKNNEHKQEIFKPTDYDVALKILTKINNSKSK